MMLKTEKGKETEKKKKEGGSSSLRMPVMD